jgi:type II secretory pathway pseudopilin PulG
MRARLAADDGATLIEMVVGMVIMMIFLGIFTAVMMMMSRSETKAQTVSETATQVNQGFLWLDRNVRYASGISTPGSASGDFYVELSNTGTSSEVCTQVRLHVANKQLQKRSWTVSGTSYANLTSWVPIADSITNTTTPFSVAATATGSEIHQQLAVTLRSVGGPASALTTSESSFTLTAVNSPTPGTVSSLCQEVPRP